MRASKPRIAIVSDAMTQRGGAERVVEVLAELFPDAPIFPILYSAQTGPRSLQSRVRPSFLNALPGARRHHRWYFPLFPLAVESFDLSGYDIIISSHHCAAKGRPPQRMPDPHLLLPFANAGVVGANARGSQHAALTDAPWGRHSALSHAPVGLHRRFARGPLHCEQLRNAQSHRKTLWS